jgi:hypothetical protein
MRNAAVVAAPVLLLAQAAALFIAGRNLLHRIHLETDDAQRAQRIERSVFWGTRVRF